MAYSITNLKADLTGVLHGTTLNQITNLDGLIYRAARQVIRDVDPQETIRIIPFTNPIYNQVFDYAVPTDLKGTKIIDIRPQVNRYMSDIWLQSYNQAFDLMKTLTLQDMFTIQFNSSLKTIRIAAPNAPTPILVNQASQISENGTWAVGGNASNLQQDNVNYVAGGSSLSFDLSSGADPSTGYLENTTSTAVDLTEQLNQGSFFIYVYLPTGLDFDNIKLRWGSSSTNYYEVTATTTQENTVFQNGWNLVAFPWLGATVVGTPDVTAIDYLRVTYTYDGSTQTAVRLNNIVVANGQILNVEYYSKYMFRDASTGAFQETVTDDSNLVNLDTDSYDLLFYQVAYLAAQQQQGKNALQYDGSTFLNLYNDAVSRYKAMYKSQVQKPQSTYYQQPNPAPTQWWGRGRYGW